MFFTGGILDRYARDRRVGAHGFFAACGVFFFRFLRLAIAAGVAYWFLFAYMHEWLFAKWYVNATRDIPVERTVFFWRVLMYAILIALIAAVTLVFDYAKIRVVVEDRRSMMGASIAALRFIVRNPSRVIGLYIINAVLFLAVVGVWGLIDQGAGGSGAWMWAGVAVSQCYILARLVVKLQVLASETALFQRSLAHWGYVASSPAIRPEARSSRACNWLNEPQPRLLAPSGAASAESVAAASKISRRAAGTARRTRPSTPAGSACRAGRIRALGRGDGVRSSPP